MRILDLFCGAGGAAEGYRRAGFEVVCVDLSPQPRYPFVFIQGDALEALRLVDVGGFDAIHASPPCQHASRVTAWRGDRADHPNLIPETRRLLEATGLPWVIENVSEARVRRDGFLCGTMFGLPLRRHRAFEFSWGRPLLPPSRCQHHHEDLAFEHKQERAYADAMGCGWMTSREGRQAIPPAFTEFIGAHLLERITEAAA